jgi:uncharacterized protein
MTERAPGSDPPASSVRLLVPDDAAAAARFLLQRWESSLFLLSALEAAGLGPGRTREHGTWAGLFDAQGALLGIAAHLGFGTITLQCPPELLGELVRLCAKESGRPVTGFGGPRAQVLAARDAVGRHDVPLLFDEAEQLLAMPITSLRVPQALASGRLLCRKVPVAEARALVPWRVAFLLETKLALAGPQLEEDARSLLQMVAGKGRLFLLEEGGAPKAMCAFNAAAGGIVQLGSVYTPQELRSRGYARAVVAGALLLAQQEGAQKAVLFTGMANAPALKAYRGLGFIDSGDYSLLLFRDSWREPA